MRIGLAQIDSTVGDIAGNLARCLEAIENAASSGADLVLLPELALAGYPPEDLLARADFVEAVGLALGTLAQRAAAPAFVGYVAAEGGTLYNAAAFVRAGAVQAIYRKRMLPNYGVFDERRYFEPGDGDLILDIAGLRCAVTICEDIWYPETVTRLADSGAEVVLNLSASPFHLGKGAEREAMLAGRARENRVWIAYCNLVGGQDELVFDGRSVVLSPAGDVIARAASFDPDLVLCDIGGPALEAGAAAGAIVPMLEGPAEVYRALETGLADYVRKNGFTDVVLGLSGGIDSALVAAVATDALGPGHVHGVLMPGPYSSEGSVTDARALAEALRIETITLPVTPAFESFRGTLAPALAGGAIGITEENLQARIRGTLLMALSNAHGWLVLATGNKSETSVGYSTLYGDMAGGFAPIKDVFKTLVYELARWRNAPGVVIPEATLTKPPSAELRPDQVDEDSLPPYDLLDAVLAAYIEEDRSVAEIVAGGHDDATVVRIAGMVDAAEYKRRQAAPGTRITPKAFGRDRRMPISNRFRHR